jgi:hypothetical protein
VLHLVRELREICCVVSNGGRHGDDQRRAAAALHGAAQGCLGDEGLSALRQAAGGTFEAWAARRSQGESQEGETREATMSDPFRDYFAVLAYAKVNDLEIAWEHSPPFRKWSRRLPPDEFEVREVLHTRKGAKSFMVAMIDLRWSCNSGYLLIYQYAVSRVQPNRKAVSVMLSAEASNATLICLYRSESVG